MLNVSPLDVLDHRMAIILLDTNTLPMLPSNVLHSTVRLEGCYNMLYCYTSVFTLIVILVSRVMLSNVFIQWKSIKLGSIVIDGMISGANDWLI